LSFFQGQRCSANALTLHVWISRGIFGWSVAFGVLVVHRLAWCVFSTNYVLARVRPLLSLFAYASFAWVTCTTRRAKALVTPGNVFTSAVLSARVRRTLIGRSCKTVLGWNIYNLIKIYNNMIYSLSTYSVCIYIIHFMTFSFISYNFKFHLIVKNVNNSLNKCKTKSIYSFLRIIIM